MSNCSAPRFSWKLLSPRYWPTLVMILVMYVLSWLPYVVQRRLGQVIGRLTLGLMKKRRFTIKRNLELCFPDMPEQERLQIVKANIDNSGLALFETGMAWFWSDARVKRTCAH